MPPQQSQPMELKVSLWPHGDLYVVTLGHMAELIMSQPKQR